MSNLDLDKSKCLLVSLDKEHCAVGYQSWLAAKRNHAKIRYVIKNEEPVKMDWPDSPVETLDEIAKRTWKRRWVLIHASGGNYFFVSHLNYIVLLELFRLANLPLQFQTLHLWHEYSSIQPAARKITLRKGWKPVPDLRSTTTYVAKFMVYF